MRNLFITSAGLLILSVLLGAFGAHGLEKILTPALLKTFHTGVHYHQLHALGLGMMALYYNQLGSSKTQFPHAAKFILLGIILFSGNCYLYALTGFKFFALLVPLGGTCFILGWSWWMKDIFSLSSIPKGLVQEERNGRF